MPNDILLKKSSTLGAILELIHDKHPIQEKRLTKELSKKDAESLVEAEEIAAGYLGFLKNQKTVGATPLSADNRLGETARNTPNLL